VPGGEARTVADPGLVGEEKVRGRGHRAAAWTEDRRWPAKRGTDGG